MLVDQTLYPTLANPKPTGKLYHIPRVNPVMLKFQIEESMINLLSDTSLSIRMYHSQQGPLKMLNLVSDVEFNSVE